MRVLSIQPIALLPAGSHAHANPIGFNTKNFAVAGGDDARPSQITFGTLTCRLGRTKLGETYRGSKVAYGKYNRRATHADLGSSLAWHNRNQVVIPKAGIPAPIGLLGRIAHPDFQI